MTRPTEWAWTNADGAELRVMRLPERQRPYIVLNDEFGMRIVARLHDDRAGEWFASWLDSALGRDREGES